MKLSGSQTMPAPPEQVWEVIHDPDVLAAIMPGCKEMKEVGEDEYEGTIEAKIGPVSSQYHTHFTVSDKDYPHSYRLQLHGEGSGGFVDGDVHIRLEAAGEDETEVHYDGTANVGGPIARVGQRLVGSVAKSLIKKGFSDLRDEVEERTS